MPARIKLLMLGQMLLIALRDSHTGSIQRQLMIKQLPI
jgi:hypothetical protein